MSTYNFPHQQDTSCPYHYLSTNSGDMIVVNSSPNYYVKSASNHGNTKPSTGSDDQERAAREKAEREAREKAEREAREKEEEEGDAGVISSQKITKDHAKVEQCGEYARIYNRVEQLIDCQGFNTHGLIRLWHSKMYDNAEIREHIEDGTYSAVNYVFAFASNLDSTSAMPSNMSCKKCEDEPENFACKDGEFKSFCYSLGAFDNSEYNKNLLTNERCPNLVSKSSEISTIKAKQISPLILVNESGEMIGKDGKNTGKKYGDFKDCLGSNNKSDNTECGEIMREVAWKTNKVISLQVPNNTEKESTYSLDDNNQDDFYVHWAF